MKWFFSNAGYALWKALDHPEHWVVNSFNAVYKNRISLWVANGASHYDVEPGRGTLGWFERHILWRKHKRMVSRLVAGTFIKALLD